MLARKHDIFGVGVLRLKPSLAGLPVAVKRPVLDKPRITPLRTVLVLQPANRLISVLEDVGKVVILLLVLQAISLVLRSNLLIPTPQETTTQRMDINLSTPTPQESTTQRMELMLVEL